MSDNIIKTAIAELIGEKKDNKGLSSFLSEHDIGFFGAFIGSLLGEGEPGYCPKIISQPNRRGRIDIDKYTSRQKLSSEESRLFIAKLKRIFKDKGKKPDRYLLKGDDNAVFKLNFLIKSAFDLELSFEEFTTMVNKAGYTLDIGSVYPPYYFLRYMLERQCWDYNEYSKGLTDMKNISVLLETKIISLEDFSEAVIKNYFMRKRSAYKMTLQEALADLQFQTDFIQFLFNAVYISGELSYKER